MSSKCFIIDQSGPLTGQVTVAGAKNAVLVIISSLLLTSGKSILRNVPDSDDVHSMIRLLQILGAAVHFDVTNHTLFVDTTDVRSWSVGPEIMKKMRASILVMGPLLARFGRSDVALPGGCVLGARPIDYHLKGFAKMGAQITFEDDHVKAHATSGLHGTRFVLEYPSVGATENVLMAATRAKGTTTIINAAIEPEVLDLVDVLRKMGAQISVIAPATIEIEGVEDLLPIEHDILADRLEAGTLILAAAITGGSVTIPNAPSWSMDVFYEKLLDMGHTISVGDIGYGVSFQATKSPRAVSFKTMPYPGFPTDLQAPMVAIQCLASGTSTVYETVYENRLVHARELEKMGAQITVDGGVATIKGVDALYGNRVNASDIRASAALIIAGLAAQGQTVMTGINHVERGYQDLDTKLARLGGKIFVADLETYDFTNTAAKSVSSRVIDA